MEAEPIKAEPPKQKRRWFQFSLRTLMIGVTLLAVVCGPITWLLQVWKSECEVYGVVKAAYDRRRDEIIHEGGDPRNDREADGLWEKVIAQDARVQRARRIKDSLEPH